MIRFRSNRRGGPSGKYVSFQDPGTGEHDDELSARLMSPLFEAPYVVGISSVIARSSSVATGPLSALQDISEPRVVIERMARDTDDVLSVKTFGLDPIDSPDGSGRALFWRLNGLSNLDYSAIDGVNNPAGTRLRVCFDGKQPCERQELTVVFFVSLPDFT